MSEIRKPYKLDDELTDRLLQAIRLGSYIEHACAYAGINSSTYRRRRQNAELEIEPYKSLFEKIHNGVRKYEKSRKRKLGIFLIHIGSCAFSKSIIACSNGVIAGPGPPIGKTLRCIS